MSVIINHYCITVVVIDNLFVYLHILSYHAVTRGVNPLLLYFDTFNMFFKCGLKFVTSLKYYKEN